MSLSPAIVIKTLFKETKTLFSFFPLIYFVLHTNKHREFENKLRKLFNYVFGFANDSPRMTETTTDDF